MFSDSLLDVEQWVQSALNGKIYRCEKRMVAEWQKKLFNDPLVDSIPADKEKLINMIVARDDYQNRVEREKS